MHCENQKGRGPDWWEYALGGLKDQSHHQRVSSEFDAVKVNEYIKNKFGGLYLNAYIYFIIASSMRRTAAYRGQNESWIESAFLLVPQ